MRIAIIIGSDTDWEIVKPCCELLKKFDVSLDVRVLSAHRTPDDLVAYMKHHEDCEIFICAAGKAAHLAGAVAARTIRPVIGIPIASSLGGLDALLSTVQMPPGVPVCTTAIDGATNAALLAIQMLALYDAELREKLRDYKSNQIESVRTKDYKLQQQVK